MRAAVWATLVGGLVAVWGWTAPSAGQETPVVPEGTAPLSLQDCLRIAAQNHGNLKAAEQSLRAAQEAVTIARASLYPQLRSSNTYFRGRTEGRQSGFQQQRTGFTTESKQYSLSASWSIWDGGRSRLRLSQARTLATGARYGREEAWQNLAFSVTSAYFEVLRARRLAELAQQQLAASEGHLELVDGRIAAGETAPIDRYPVQVEVANARLSLLTARNQLRIARTDLANAMGLGLGEMPEIAEVAEPEIAEVDLQASLQAAAVGRADLGRARSQVAAAETGVKLARVDRYPVISLSSSFEEGLGHSPTQRRWQINAGLTYSLFDAGAARASVRQGQADLEAARASLDQLRKDAAAEVEQAYLLLLNARERIAASRVVVDEAQRNLDAANEKFRLGLAIVLEIVDAQVAYFNAQNSLIQAIYDYHIAHAQLERSTGAASYPGTED